MAELFIDDEKVELKDGERIAAVCEEAGVPFACEEGICGTCVIEVIDGEENLSERTQEEIDFLGEIPCGERLACQCRILKSCVRIKI
ncbi:MAG: fdiv1 [Chlamydiales bacterium]|jgi:ferredoxin|nr:fdiv1 [Chlamydiales bacterium]